MESDLDLRRYLQVFRRWWWLIVGCALLAAVAAYAISTQMTRVYSASVTLLVHPTPTRGTSDYAALLTSERQARTYAEMLTEKPVLEEVIATRSLTGTLTWKELAGRVSVEMVQDTQLIRLSVEDTDANRAKDLADGVAETFIRQNQALQQERYAESLVSMRQQMEELSALIQQTQEAMDALEAPETPQEQSEMARLETILAGYRTSYVSLLQSYEQMRLEAAQAADNVSLWRRAERPEEAIRPRTMLNTVLAGVGGMVLAVGMAFLIEYLDDTIKTSEDVWRALGLNTVGLITRMKKGTEELVALVDPVSPSSEAFRVLRTNIRFSSVDRPIRTLLVTSAEPAEGKSLVVANLAVVMAQSGLKVVTMDGDLRRPRLHRLFGIRPRGGLTGSLLDGNMDGRLQQTQLERLAVLPAGDLPPNPAELLGSRRLRELLGLLTQHVDVVVIDSPPVLPVTDAAVLAQGVDGVLLVVDAGVTRRGVAQQAVESLNRVGANLIGVVLNKVPVGRGGYYYYYEEYYENGRRKQRKRRERRKRESVARPGK